MKPKVKTWFNQIESGMITSNTTKILNYIMNHNGCTILNMRRDLLCSHQTMTAIISILMDEGLVKAIGEIEVDGSHYSKFCYLFSDVDRIKQIEKKECSPFFTLRGKKSTTMLLPLIASCEAHKVYVLPKYSSTL